MSKSLYWADSYIGKKRSSKQAITVIRPGGRVFIGSYCGEPQELVRKLVEGAINLKGIEIVRMMSSEMTSLADIADKTEDHSLNIRSIYSGSANTDVVARHMRFITPLNISEVSSLFMNKRLPIDVALIQVSPPDDFGWMSLGVSVDVTLAAAQSATTVIAQVNSNMPRTMGQSFIHINEVDYIVECDESILSIHFGQESELALRIGKHLTGMIEDGSTLQLGPGTAFKATYKALLKKNDLGLHSQYITDDAMHLYSAGVMNSRKKGFLNDKLVCSCAVGSENLYEFINDNPAIEIRPSNFVNNPSIISRNNKMISINVAYTVDLVGQVSAEASARTLLAGVSSFSDFVRGAKGSKGGKSIVVLYSTSRNGKTSNIVPFLSSPAIVPMFDAHYMVTEYGVVNLFAKSLQERALAMISIAHPNFRDELLEAAKKAKLISSTRSLGKSRQGVYPVYLEKTVEIDSKKIKIRPAKPVDERRIQEYYYKLDKEGIRQRFLHSKNSFNRQDVEASLHIDYIRNLTLVGITGELGFGKIVGLAEYFLIQNNNLAEVAFSISKSHQNKGLGKIFIKKLSKEAINNGIDGFLAYTSFQNKAMISLFKTLPYKTYISTDSGMLLLKCYFNEKQTT